MEINFETVKDALSKNPDLARQVSEHVVNETESGKAIRDNFAESRAEEARKETTRTLYNNLDKDIHSITGEMKPQDMKTFDWMKQQLKKVPNGEPSEEVQELKNKNEELQKQLDAQGSDYWKKTYENSQSDFQKALNAKDQELTSLRTEMNQSKIKSKLETAAASMQYNKAIPKEAIAEMRESALNRLSAQAKYGEDGNIIFVDDNGARRHPSTHEVMGPEAALRLEMKAFLDNGPKTPGGGGAGNNPDPSNKFVGEGDDKRLVLSGSYTTRVDVDNAIVDAMREEGIAVGSENYQQIYDNTRKEYVNDEMPLV